MSLFATAVLFTPSLALGRSLPPEVAAAGFTEAAWRAVELKVQRAAREKHVSEKALGAVAMKIGVTFVQDRQLNLDTLIGMLDERCNQLIAFEKRLGELERADRSSTSALVGAALAAIDAGKLDRGQDLLSQARAYAKRDASPLKEAQVVEVQANLFDLKADYIGSAALYGESASLVAKGSYIKQVALLNEQAQALTKRGELFSEPQRLYEAVQLYRNVILPLVPRGVSPLAWAMIQINLGSPLQTLGERGDDQALRDAGSAARQALEVFTREGAPLLWAASQNNLGNALVTFGERGDNKALKEAVQSFRDALSIYSLERTPEQWATTQNNLGIALEVLGLKGDSEALNDAITAYRSALKVRTQDGAPADWAATQNNLGTALTTLGERGDAQALREAISAYRLALQIRTRARTPAGWAETQNNLGFALKVLGLRGNDQALLEAVNILRQALEVRTFERAPIDWAATQTNLGGALSALGERGDDRALEGAVSALRAALEVYTPEKYSAQHKLVTQNLIHTEEIIRIKKN